MRTLILISPLLIFAVFISINIGMRVVNFFSRWRRSNEKLAKRYKGQLTRSGFPFYYPGVTFNYGKTFCQLRHRRGKLHEAGRQTDLVFMWPDPTFNFRLMAGDIRAGKWAFGGLNEVALPTSDFEERFKVESNRPAVATRMLNSNVQWAFEQLRRHTFKKTLYVSIRKGRMIVSKADFMKDYADVDDFIRFSLELYDQLVVADVEGIEFLNEQQAKVVEEVKCPICSEKVEEFMVVCLRCKTPHCYDCWQYNGRCATFACDETRYVRMDDRIKYAS